MYSKIKGFSVHTSTTQGYSRTFLSFGSESMIAAYSHLTLNVYVRQSTHIAFWVNASIN